MTTAFSSDIIIKKSLKTFFQHIAFFSALAIVLIVPTMLIGYYLTQGGINNLIPIIVFGILIFIMYIKVVVMIHRSVLLNEFKLSNAKVWTKNELFFAIALLLTVLLYWLLFYILINTLKYSELIGNSSLFSAGFFYYVFLILFAIFFSRLAIIFPSLAVGNPLSLKRCWNITRKYNGSIFALVIVFPYLTNIFLKIVPEDTIIWSIVGLLITVLVSIIEIIIVSHSYQVLVHEINKDSKTMAAKDNQIA